MKFKYSYECERAGKTIRKVRISKGFSQMRLSELCGISESHIKKIESGKAHASLDVLVRICNTLEIPFEYLFTNLAENPMLTSSQTEFLNGLKDNQQIVLLEMLQRIIHSKEGE
jgi:transcriptional regulator with XRE-family HTH domain